MAPTASPNASCPASPVSKPSTNAPTGQLPCTAEGAKETPCSATRHMVQADGTEASKTGTPAGGSSTRAMATGGVSSFRRSVSDAAAEWGPGMGPELVVDHPATCGGCPVVVDHGPSPCAAEAAPAVPEQQRQHQADGTHDHEDETYGVDVDAANVHVDREVEDGTNGDEEDARPDAHVKSSLCPLGAISEWPVSTLRFAALNGRERRQACCSTCRPSDASTALAPLPLPLMSSFTAATIWAVSWSRSLVI